MFGWWGARIETDMCNTCAAEAFAARSLIAVLREMCMDQADIVIKSDGEAAIKAVTDDLAGLPLAAKTMREEALRGSSATNGIAERAVKCVTHQLKVIKVWLEGTWGNGADWYQTNIP